MCHGLSIDPRATFIPRATRTIIWTRLTAKSSRAISPTVWRVIIRNIKPSSKRILAAYVGRVGQGDCNRWQSLAAPLKGTKFVAYHSDWAYFANRFSLQQIGSIEAKARNRADTESLGGSCPKNAARKSATDHLRAAERPLSAASSRLRPALTVVRLAKHRRRHGGNRQLYQVHRLQPQEFACRAKEELRKIIEFNSVYDNSRRRACVSDALPLVSLRAATPRLRRRRRYCRPLTWISRAGDFIAMAGPNGSGKTTIFRTILGFLPVIERRAGAQLLA